MLPAILENIYGTVGPGEFFGEIGLVNKQPRIATVISLDTDVKVGLFNRDSFFLLAKSSPEFLFNMFRSAIVKLSQANLQFIQLTETASLSDGEEREIDSRYVIKQYNIRNYVNDVATKNYMKNDIVFLESDVSDGSMYFIFEGEFLVSHKDKEGIDRHITTLKYGDFFGEMALLNSKPRSATIKVISLNSKVAKLDKGVFIRVSRLNPEFLFMFLRVMFARLSATEEKISKLLAYMGN